MSDENMDKTAPATPAASVDSQEFRHLLNIWSEGSDRKVIEYVDKHTARAVAAERADLTAQWDAHEAARRDMQDAAAPQQHAQAAQFPARDASKPAEQQGIFEKFSVQRTDGSDALGEKHHGCKYFVLDLDHDIHASIAMRAYAKSCRTTHPVLADDIENAWGRFENDPALNGHAQAALSVEPQGIVFAHPDSQKLKPLVVDWYRASFMDDGKQWRAITQYVLSLTRAQQKITWDHARAILAASQQPAAAPMMSGAMKAMSDAGFDVSVVAPAPVQREVKS